MIRNKFIKRSIDSAVDFFKDAVFSEDIARQRGLLQAIDPRIKLVLLVGLLVVTCLVRGIGWMSVFYLTACLLALLSSIDLVYFFKRVWFFIPIFTLLIAIPALFMQGLYYAALFVMRVATCVSFVVVFTVTTRHDRLLKSLRSIGVPDIFVQVLDMTYRYIFLFIKVFEEMHTGLESRLVKGFSNKISRRWIASRIAYLFRRSMKMSEEVYMAMLARGYKG